MALPYQKSKADPVKAQVRIRQTLQKFGVDRIAFEEDFASCELALRFMYNGYPVKLPVNYRTLSERFLREEPWSSRRRCSKPEWEKDKREVAYRSVFSILEDFLRAAITLIDMGLFSFEEVFIGHFQDSKGRRLGDMMAPKLQEFFTGKLMLEEGTR